MEDKINELERAMQHIEREQRYLRLVQEAKRIENGFRNIEKVQLIKEKND